MDASLSVTVCTDDAKEKHATISAFWKGELGNVPTWYDQGDKYWGVSTHTRSCPGTLHTTLLLPQREDVPPTLDGMLGGLAHVSPDDT